MTRTSLLFCLAFWGKCLFAQNIDQQQLVDNLAIEYLQASGSQSVLFYGRIHEGHPRVVNHPYFEDEQFTKARLSYRGIIYPEAMLRLDLSRNELVVLSPSFLNFVLFPEDVDFAELHGQTIIYYQRNDLPGSPPTGYYALLHSGKCRVLERQTAALMVEQSSSPGRAQYRFAISTQFFLYKDGVYHNIRNQRRLLNTLHPHQRELRRFISSNQLRFRRNARELITLTVMEYEKLSNPL